MNRNQPPRGRIIGPSSPGGALVPSRPAPSYSQPQMPSEAMGGDGMGSSYVTGGHLRKALEGVERRVNEQLGAFRNDTNARLEDIFKFQPQSGVALGNPYDALAGLDESVRQAVTQGRCQFYALSTDIFFEAGETSRQFGGVILTNAGPMFIVKMLAYAQIDDVNAEAYPFSLLDAPSCSADTPGSTLGVGCETLATSFTANCSTIIPKINANGMYIPVSPRNCKLIAAGTETCCFTETCDGVPRTFAGKVPIMVLDHPECVDGITEVNVNGCLWSNVPYPLAFWEDGMFNFTNDSPSCVGVCGYLDCQKQLDISLTLTRPLRYAVDVQFVLAGFRIFTC